MYFWGLGRENGKVVFGQQRRSMFGDGKVVDELEEGVTHILVVAGEGWKGGGGGDGDSLGFYTVHRQ
jgi:hypothetical protein